jgi:hypothetical protein
MEGYPGERLGVRWSDGSLRWICTHGMETLHDGSMHLFDWGRKFRDQIPEQYRAEVQ